MVKVKSLSESHWERCAIRWGTACRSESTSSRSDRGAAVLGVSEMKGVGKGSGSMAMMNEEGAKEIESG